MHAIVIVCFQFVLCSVLCAQLNTVPDKMCVQSYEAKRNLSSLVYFYYNAFSIGKSISMYSVIHPCDDIQYV